MHITLSIVMRESEVEDYLKIIKTAVFL